MSQLKLLRQSEDFSYKSLEVMTEGWKKRQEQPCEEGNYMLQVRQLGYREHK